MTFHLLALVVSFMMFAQKQAKAQRKRNVFSFFRSRSHLPFRRFLHFFALTSLFQTRPSSEENELLLKKKVISL